MRVKANVDTGPRRFFTASGRCLDMCCLAATTSSRLFCFWFYSLATDDASWYKSKRHIRASSCATMPAWKGDFSVIFFIWAAEEVSILQGALLLKQGSET